MLITTFAAGPWQANCYVVSPAGPTSVRRPAVVVDPGVEALDALTDAITEHDLEPTAVLLTHGHVDHVASAASFADPLGLPVYVHPADEFMLTDPVGGIGEDARPLLRQLGLDHLDPPKRVEELRDGDRVQLADLEFDLLHAPGHSPGCTLLRLADTPHGPVVFAGDVIFQGSIGRTDLAGGDPDTMRRSLREVVLGLDDATHLLPGHGGQTTMASERATNPYLQDAFLLDETEN